MRIALLTSALVLAGCAVDGERPADRNLSLSDFSTLTDASASATPKTYYGETPMVDVKRADLINGDPQSDAKTEGACAARGAVFGAPVDASGTPHWMVDGLVGQINGRPVFANDFLESLEAQLKLIAARPSARQNLEDMKDLIHRRFQVFVNSELIISEAESQLTPEQQQGVFAWLRGLQEQEIASLGGTRAEANKRLEEELGMEIDEFMQQKRDEELSRYLLGRKVQPRTIVSWRDVERYYRQNENSINPPPTIQFGRISLNKKTDADKIDTVMTMVQADATFVEIAKAVGAPKDGVWEMKGAKPRDMTIAEAIDANEDLRVEIKQRLRDSKLGRPSAPLEDTTTVQWFAILEVTDPPAQSIFDPELQLRIKDSLRNQRERIEESRYITRLRTRWISDDIKAIEERVIAIAVARYLN